MFPRLSQFRPYMNAKPSSIFGIMSPKISSFIKYFANADSRAKLIQKWKQQPTFLLDEYLKWIQQLKWSDVKSIWPPISK